MPHSKPGRRTASRRCCVARTGGLLLPQDAARQVLETGCFQEMLRGMSGSRAASPRCCAACPEAELLPADAARQDREASGQALVRASQMGWHLLRGEKGSRQKKIQPLTCW